MTNIVPAPTGAAHPQCAPSPTLQMTSAELRAFLNENAAEREAEYEQGRRARYLSAAIRRAESLFQDGYSAREFGPQFPGLWIVTKPSIVNALGWKEFTGCYAVTVSADFQFCTCPAFHEWNECKHHLAIAREIEITAAFEADCERAEEAREFFAESYSQAA